LDLHEPAFVLFSEVHFFILLYRFLSKCVSEALLILLPNFLYFIMMPGFEVLELPFEDQPILHEFLLEGEHPIPFQDQLALIQLFEGLHGLDLTFLDTLKQMRRHLLKLGLFSQDSIVIIFGLGQVELQLIQVVFHLVLKCSFLLD
jgi:hypothetical protein